MKKFSFLVLAIAGMLFAACSSDKDVAGDEPNNPIAVGNNGYFKVNLNLPTTVVSSMRAPGDGWGDEGDNVADGLTKEYAVNSVLLLIFEGDDEASATLKQAMTPTSTITPNPDPAATDNPNQVTATREYVAKLDNAPTNNLFALAVINGTEIIEQGTVNTAVKINGGANQSNITIADLQVATSNSMKEGDKFFMTNAVLSKSEGGATDPGASPTLQILAPVKSEYIYETEDDAKAGVPATDIYVERGVAKVTVDKTAFALNAGIQSKDVDPLAATFDGWVLDNTEKESYIVRKVPDIAWNLTSKQAITTDKYRFVGGNAVDKLYGTANLYRTYWAEDLQYDDVVVADNMNRSTNPTFQETFGDNNPQYCHENTFDVAHQTHENTTRVIVKVTLSGFDGADFYTIGADRKTLYSLNNVKDLVITDLMDQSAFAAYWQTNSESELTKDDLDITFSSNNAGVITVSDITIDETAFTPNPPAAPVSVKTAVGESVITTLNTQLAKVEKFQGGVSYYVIRVQHFGELLTPWNSSEWAEGYKPATGDVSTIYPDAEDSRQIPNYLGRYGMVRNNWYDIHVGEIMKIGSSTVPTLPGDDTPDDDLDELYIKARINILSWAKRLQNWTLK